MVTDCSGACNAAYRAASEDDPDRPDPVPGEPVWCHRDAARIQGRLTDLETLAALLEHVSDGYGEAPGDPRSGNGHAPTPSPRLDTLDECERMPGGGKPESRRAKGWGTPGTHGRYATVSAETTSWLSRHFPGILESPFAREFGDEVLGAARELVLRPKRAAATSA